MMEAPSEGLILRIKFNATVNEKVYVQSLFLFAFGDCRRNAMTRQLGKAIFFLAAVIVAIAPRPNAAQTTVPIVKVWTPEQKKAQAEYAKYEAARTALKATAQAALSTEMAREKAGDCPKTQSTYDFEVCLSTQTAKTQENYAAFAGALRSMLGLNPPVWPGVSTAQFISINGTPPTPEQEVASLDEIEAEAKVYREHAGKIAFQQFQGGTLAPVYELEAGLKLLRSHMQELAFVYGELLSDH